MTPAAANHLRILALLPAIEALGADGAWLAACYREFDAHVARGLRLETALGLAPSYDSEAPFHLELGLQRRQVLLEDLYRTYEGAKSARAKAIASDARNFAAGVWRAREPNDSAQATRVGLLQQLQQNSERTRAKWPLAWRQVQELCEVCNCTPLPTANDADVPSRGSLVEHGKGQRR